MADKPPAEEPSIEEILGSIRRIIAEDEDPAVEEAPLELTNKIDADGTIVNPPIEDKISFEDPAPVAEVAPAPPPPAPAPVAAPPVVTPEKETPKMSEENILSQTTADATAAVMSKLARHTVVTEEGASGVTLEGIVREMLKPLLREWLEHNLPPIVEKAVDREIERLSRRV